MSVSASEYQVGRKVQLVLKSSTRVSGVVFAVDVPGNKVIIEESMPGERTALRDTRIVNLAAVESASFDGGDLVPMEPLSANLTKELAAKREKASFVTREEALLKTGSLDGLSKQVYDNLSKIYSSCRWHEREKRIEIKGLQVSVKHPFRPADVEGHDVRAVKYVRDLLEKMHLPK